MEIKVIKNANKTVRVYERKIVNDDQLAVLNERPYRCHCPVSSVDVAVLAVNVVDPGELEINLGKNVSLGNNLSSLYISAHSLLH